MTFQNLVGHQRARALLSRTLASATVPAGYLFTGPAGIGKHLAAAGFVRAFLCTAAGPGPCGVCPSCRLAGGAAHPDLIEVTLADKKKSITVDQVRELGAWLAQSPALGRRKAALIDPADALNDNAANALLKILEEPPAGRVIVLVATRAGALPPTVRSRCQQVSFGPLADGDVAEVLRRHSWPAQAAHQAAVLAEGSPGVALARDGRAWQENVAAVRALLEALAAGDTGAVLAFAESSGDARERTLSALAALIAFSRSAVRRRLGDRGADPDSVPAWLDGLDADALAGMLSGAMEIHRRLEGDRPPNAKLALATLLVGASGTGVGR